MAKNQIIFEIDVKTGELTKATQNIKKNTKAIEDQEKTQKNAAKTSNNYDNLEFSQDISNEDLLVRFYKVIFDSDLIEEAAMEANIIDYYSSIQEVLGSINVSIDKKNLTASILYTSKDKMLLEESKLFITNLIDLGNNAVVDGVIQTYENRKKDLLRRASVITNTHESEINERIISKKAIT